jgi:hypothetical protein
LPAHGSSWVNTSSEKPQQRNKTLTVRKAHPVGERRRSIERAIETIHPTDEPARTIRGTLASEGGDMPQPSQIVTPNLYHLSGHHLHVTYTTSSIDGKPTMSYQDAHQSKSFRGDEIRAVECDVGTLVSVTLRMTPDIGSTSLSLLVPRVRIVAGTTAAIRSECVTTLHSMPFAPQTAQGQLDTYHVVAVQGTAQHVAF